MWYAMRNIASAGLLWRTIVVTDDDSIAKVATNFGVEVCREPTVVHENSIRAIHRAWLYAVEHLRWKVDVIVSTTTTSPCYSPLLIHRTAEALTDQHDVVQTMVRSLPLGFLAHLQVDGTVEMVAPTGLSQDMPQIHAFSGCVAALWPRILQQDFSDMAAFWAQLRIKGVVHNDPHLDIDEEGDLLWMELMLKSGRYPHLYQEASSRSPQPSRYPAGDLVM
jgi:CMP-N-acetylneuraminic acid synthetase